MCFVGSGVYMKSEDERQEYVLNETGMIWAGTHANNHIWHWNFAQVGISSDRSFVHELAYS